MRVSGRIVVATAVLALSVLAGLTPAVPQESPSERS